MNMIQALAPAVAIYLDLPLGQIITLIGVGGLSCNLFQPVVGWVMGKRNLSWSMWVACSLAVLPIFMGWATGIWSLAFLIVLGALGTGMFHPEGVLCAHDASGKRAYLGVPFFLAFGFVFSSIAAPVGINWVNTFGFRALAILAIPGLVLGVLQYSWYRKKCREHPSVVIRPRSLRMTKRITGHMSFWPLMAIAICYGTSSGLFLAILTSHYELTFGPDSRFWAGWVLLIMGGFGSLFSFLWSHLTRNGGYYLLVLLTQLGASGLFVWMAHASSPLAGFLIAIPLSMISPNSVYPVAVSLARNSSGATQAIRAGLMVGGTWGVAGIIIMIAGVLVNRGVSTSSLILFSAGTALAASLLAGAQLIRDRIGTAKK